MTARPKNTPIMMECPGSGYPPNSAGICTYCGCIEAVIGRSYVAWEVDVPLPNHNCEDILAMIERGDFG